MDKVEMTPREAKTFAQICKLERDTVESGDFWLQIGEKAVSITEQRVGESPTATIDIPRAVFNRFVRWYETGKTR